MNGRHAAIYAILACLPMDEDGTGHVADCGYDEADTCGCYSLPTRLDAIVRGHVAAALNEAADQIERAAGEIADEDPFGDHAGTYIDAARIVRNLAANDGP